MCLTHRRFLINFTEELILLNRLKKIGYLSDSTANYIFDECSELETITLPENLTYIGSNAFSSTSLKSIKIPDKVFNKIKK